MEIVKAHAFGNDFLLLDDRVVPAGTDRPALARAVCDRHRGLGADGLIFYNPDLSDSRGAPPPPVRMALLNADGSYSEVSGNGVRCLAAWIGEQAGAQPGAEIRVDTDAGLKRLELLERTPAGFVFRAAMGQPDAVSLAQLELDGQVVEAVTLRVGNPQCVVLGPVTLDRLHSLASKLAVHPHFPHGTNVELATVESPGRVRILIWERGVGPTEASGTGACAAAVAAMTYGGANRDVEVVSPGGSQRVEWREDGLYLTGSAQIIAACDWRM
ncbi:MAG TPA: diaminopimelate epimerase [Vicinamibacterales bacterium]|nr:diaminopimelate epimerase [Vicinamibacterales bacterium]